jgi:ATP-dependent HslUV protease, peptidase subunit HslV
MTTIVVAKKNGVAVIAGDSLTTFGNSRLPPEYDASWEKIVKHGDTYFGLAGSAAHQLVMESLLKRASGVSFHGKYEIFESFRKMHPLLKEEHFLNPKEEEDDPYESSQVIALIANKTGIFAVFSMREVFEYTKFWAIGTGRDYALGAMFACYDRFETAHEIAEIGVRAGAEFDVGSQMPLTLCSVKLESK